MAKTTTPTKPKLLVYNPTSTDGTGFLVPLFKSIHHIDAILSAIGLGFPVKTEQARAEFDHSLAHLAGLTNTLPFLSDNGRTYIEEWKDGTTALRDKLRDLEAAAPGDEVTEAMREEMRPHIKLTWQLLAEMDGELLGLEATERDPGTLP